MNGGRRTAIALRHVAFEDLGLLSPILDDAAWQVMFCDAAIEDLRAPVFRDADLLIVLGGPIGAYEQQAYPFLVEEIRLIEWRLARDRATLGICLGSQLMAAALGAHVRPGPVKEIGWGPVTLTNAGRQSSLRPLAEPEARVLHWHGDTFDLPRQAVRLASGLHYENQAFAHGERALGLQFHLEAHPLQLEEWYIGHAVELAAAGISVPQLRASSRALDALVTRQAQAVFADWLHRAAPGEPYAAHGT